MANQLVQAQIGPQRRQLRQDMRLQGKATTGFTEALADELGSIGGNVQGIFSNAANQTSAFSQGFSDAFKQAQQQGNTQTADILGNLGSEGQIEGATAPGSGASDVLFGQTGFLPGKSLAGQGASVAGYAAQLPGFAALQGQQNLARQQSEFGSASQELSKQRRELFQEIYQQLLQNELNKYGARINAGYLGNAQAQTQLDALGLQADISAGKRDDRKDKNKAKQEKIEKKEAYFDKWSERVYDIAEKYASKTKPNPNPLEDPLPNPLPYREAFNRIWKLVAPPLRKRGFKGARIRAMIIAMLDIHGIKNTELDDPHVGGGGPGPGGL